MTDSPQDPAKPRKSAARRDLCGRTGLAAGNRSAAPELPGFFGEGIGFSRSAAFNAYFGCDESALKSGGRVMGRPTRVPLSYAGNIHMWRALRAAQAVSRSPLPGCNCNKWKELR